MKPTPRQLELINKLGLRGTMLEQLVLTPGAMSRLDQVTDSPSLMRFALDVRRALADGAFGSSEPEAAAMPSHQPVFVRR